MDQIRSVQNEKELDISDLKQKYADVIAVIQEPGWTDTRDLHDLPSAVPPDKFVLLRKVGGTVRWKREDGAALQPSFDTLPSRHWKTFEIKLAPQSLKTKARQFAEAFGRLRYPPAPYIHALGLQSDLAAAQNEDTRWDSCDFLIMDTLDDVVRLRERRHGNPEDYPERRSWDT